MWKFSIKAQLIFAPQKRPTCPRVDCARYRYVHHDGIAFAVPYLFSWRNRTTDFSNILISKIWYRHADYKPVESLGCRICTRCESWWVSQHRRVPRSFSPTLMILKIGMIGRGQTLVYGGRTEDKTALFPMVSIWIGIGVLASPSQFSIVATSFCSSLILDTHWGGAGSSRIPSSDTYCGTRAFSEPETTAVSNYAKVPFGLSPSQFS